jgi:anthranilate synthase component II
MSILILDNYDSFTYNLFHTVEKLCDESIDVIRNDEIALSDVDRYDSIILSPGPGLPQAAGITMDVLRTYASSKKILGVCLGHQAMAEAFGGSLMNLPTVHHGVSSICTKENADELFSGIPDSFQIGHYHSWVVAEPLPGELLVTARSTGGEVMAMRHRELNLRGVQFHPESVLTPQGERLLSNWLLM